VKCDDASIDRTSLICIYFKSYKELTKKQIKFCAWPNKLLGRSRQAREQSGGDVTVCRWGGLPVQAFLCSVCACFCNVCKSEHAQPFS
jgi:hypothetical protein